MDAGPRAAASAITAAMKTLLCFAAILEAVTGLALILDPALVTRLLLVESAAGVAAALGRLEGYALLALGVACGRTMGRRARILREPTPRIADGVEFSVRYRAPPRADHDVSATDGIDRAPDLRPQWR